MFSFICLRCAWSASLEHFMRLLTALRTDVPASLRLGVGTWDRLLAHTGFLVLGNAGSCFDRRPSGSVHGSWCAPTLWCQRQFVLGPSRCFWRGTCLHGAGHRQDAPPGTARGCALRRPVPPREGSSCQGHPLLWGEAGDAGPGLLGTTSGAWSV